MEHFRPKAGYCQNVSDPLSTPGYYWLAYEWDNLFLSCQLCNQRHKRNLFPLVDSSARATTHQSDLAKETPLFIHPEEDPEQYISFRAEIPFAINDNDRGRTTIANLRLDRPELNAVREDLYRILQSLYSIAYILPASPETERARDLLNQSIHDSAQFSGMVRAALAMKFSINDV